MLQSFLVAMKHEVSFGIIPLKKIKEEWQVLLVQHGSGFWSFPKGHQDEGETLQETARRELREETGLDVACYLSEKIFLEKYQFFRNGERVFKTVKYLLAEVEGEVKIQEEELKDAKWFPFKEATKHVTYPEARRICEEAYTYVTHLTQK